MAQQPTGKKIVCLIVTLLLFFSVFTSVSADGGNNPFEKEAGGYKVNLVAEEPKEAGSSDIVIKLRTEQGEPVDGATVQVEVAEADGHAEEESDHASEDQKNNDDGHGSMETTQKVGDHMESKGSETQPDEHNKAQAITFETGNEPGEYHGTIDLPKAGNWVVTVHFEVDHEEYKVEFPVEVQPGFSKAGVLAGFLGVNVAVVASAAVQKRKQTAEKKAAAFAKKDGMAKKADVVESAGSIGTEKEL